MIGGLADILLGVERIAAAGVVRAWRRAAGLTSMFSMDSNLPLDGGYTLPSKSHYLLRKTHEHPN
jgi:hypothetical protein